jgi:hypothetical protein
MKKSKLGTVAFLFAFALFYWVGCQTDASMPLTGYYFPQAAAQDGIVYQFEEQGFQSGPEYWYFTSKEREDSLFLITTVYSSDFEQQQLSIERKVSNGWIQEQLLLFFPDGEKTRQASVEIKTQNTFAFDLEDSLELIHYSISWEENLDSTIAQKRLFRNKRFLGFDTLNIMGEPSRVAKFLVRDMIEDERQGTLTLHIKSYESYAQGWGLVKKDQYYMRGEKEQLIRSLRLVDTLSMSTLEREFKENLQ